MLKYEDGEKESLNLFISYRKISIIVLTIVYILLWNKNITYSKVFIILGMVMSSTAGTFIYKHNYPDNSNVIIVTIIMESLAYSIFIILSGGFSSPYLWYFINLLIVILSLKPFGRYSKLISTCLMLLMLTSVFIPKKIVISNNPVNFKYSDINTGIAFVVVYFGFYLLLESYDKLLQGRSDLLKSKKRSDYALQHTMNVYDALNLFSLSDPQKVMDELNSTLFRTIAKNGCGLFKINSLCDIDFCSCEGILEEHESYIAGFILKTIKFKEHDSLPAGIKIDDKVYHIEYIRDSSNIRAVLFIEKREEETEEHYYMMECKFYLHFVKVIMQELDIQTMIESYIISEEQNRIASEIHDTVIQKLFSISLNVSALEANIGVISDEDVKMKLKDIIKNTNSTMKTLRETIYGIKWDLNYDETLGKKLEAYVQEAMDMNNIQILLNIDEDASVLTSNKKTAFYRIICEAINNAIRHGNATEITVDVNVHDGFATGCIKDNGKGFDKNTIPKDRQGIRNMYMITGILKGVLNIDSAVGKGTVILYKIPV
jgi:signal transduction histidine kinase